MPVAETGIGGSDAPAATLRAIIIGAGFGGLGMAIALRKAGVTDFVLLERAQDVGGVWRDNHYPGAACDVPSLLYSYSFEPNPDWSHHFARQHEILEYLRHCADRYALRPHLRLGAEVREACYDEAGECWVVTLVDGSELHSRLLISATGQLSRPVIPELPGQGDFRGRVFHSACWDNTFELAGKRVAVIGTGASAIQLVPAIAASVQELRLFQRSPPYILPRRDHPVPAWRKQLYRAMPWTMRLRRLAIYLEYESRAIALTRFKSLLQLFAGMPFRRLLRAQVADAELRRQLTPDYPIGCKRVLLSDDFLPVFNRSNVTLETQPVERLTEHGIETIDGRQHAVDAIIYATGFAATKFLSPMTIRGRAGVALNHAWRDGAAAYLGMTVPGFPNFFMLYGPNTNLGHNSIIFMLESQIAHVIRILQAMDRRHARSVEVDTDRHEHFKRKLRHDLQRTAWNGCTSWYVDSHGHSSTNWPGFTLSYRWLTRHASLDGYRFSAIGADASSTIVAAPQGWYERAQASFLRGFLRVAFRAPIGPPLGARAQRALVDALAWLMPGAGGTRITRRPLNNVDTEVIAPKSGAPTGAILYLHGGAFCLGHAGTHRAISTRLALAAASTLYVPNYRLAPEHPYPAALDDALAVYRALADQGLQPAQIVLAGDSAGGALALALALRLRQLGEPPPAGLLLLSPVTDPTLSGASFESHARIDPMLRRGWVEQGLRWYDAAVDEPLHHPLQQDLAGLPPMLIQVGDREILLSDASRLSEHAARCGVPCRLEIHAGRWHVFQLQAFYLPSIARAIRTLGQFARERFTSDAGLTLLSLPPGHCV